MRAEPEGAGGHRAHPGPPPDRQRARRRDLRDRHEPHGRPGPLHRGRRRGAAGRRGLGGAPRAPRGRARPGGRPGCPRGGSQVPGPGHPPAEALVMRRPKAQNPVVGLDVGTTKICAVIAQPAAHGGLDVVGIGTAPSRGLRRGIVVNIDSTVEAIKAAVGEAEQMAGVEVAGDYAGVAGGLIRGVHSRGDVVVDIGGGTTDVSLYRNGAIWHTAVLPLGGDHISNDIAIGLRTPSPSAEDMKKRYGCALTALVPAEETVDVPSVGGRKPRQLSRQVLSEIIQPRVEEIFTLIARELGRAGFPDAATAGVVVTGGTSLMEGVSELAEAVFDQPVRRGVPLGVSGLADVVQSPIYATAAGLALHGVRGRAQAETAAATDDTRFGRLARGLSGLLNDIF